MSLGLLLKLGLRAAREQGEDDFRRVAGPEADAALEALEQLPAVLLAPII